MKLRPTKRGTAKGLGLLAMGTVVVGVVQGVRRGGFPMSLVIESMEDAPTTGYSRVTRKGKGPVMTFVVVSDRKGELLDLRSSGQKAKFVLTPWKRVDGLPLAKFLG